jgi:hypothetical protein
MTDFLRIFSDPSANAALATAQWTALGVIAGVASIIVAGSAVLFSLFQLRQQLSAAYYAELDKLYFDLTSLLLTVDGLAATCDRADDAAHDPQYDTYCLMLWNFIETVYDRCCDGNGRFTQEIPRWSWERSMKIRLFETWRPVIDRDGGRHLAWFSTPERPFKTPFRTWVSGRSWPPSTAQH